MQKYTTDIEVQPLSTPTATVDGQVVGAVGGYHTCPVVGPLGNIAYTVALKDGITSSFNSTDLVVDGKVVASGNLHSLVFSGTHLFWSERNHGGPTAQETLHRYDTLTGEILSLDLAPGMMVSNLVAQDGEVFASFLDLTTQLYSASRLEPDLTQDAPFVETANSGFLTLQDGKAVFVDISGDPGLSAFYLGAHMLVDTQFGEPIANGNDLAGRMSWNTSDRLLGLDSLLDQVPNAQLSSVVSTAISQIIANTTDEGRYVSLRYSLDPTEEISLAVNSGMVWWSALTHHDRLDPEIQTALVARAEAFMASFESNWTGTHYIFTPGISFHLDGVELPGNMQAVMGHVALRLAEITGNAAYTARAEAIFDYIVEDITVTEEGVVQWNYLDETYHLGWSEGERPSTHRPVQPASTPLSEDIWHAYITAPFLKEASDTFDRPLSFTFDMIGEQVFVSDFAFRYLLYQDSSVSFINRAPLIEVPQIRDAYTKFLPLFWNDYDSQSIFMGYMKAAESLELSAGPLQLGATTLVDGTPQRTELTLANREAVLDYWLSWRAAESVSQGPATAGDDILTLSEGGHLRGSWGDDHLMGSQSDDTLVGDGDNDTLHGLDGNDILAGNEGQDILTGNAGADRLIGGNGDDTLTGGAGNDTMYGGAGADTYTFSTNFGSDIVHEFADVGHADVFQFDSSIESRRVFLAVDADHLYVHELAADDFTVLSTVLIPDHFDHSSIETLQFQNGFSLELSPGLLRSLLSDQAGALTNLDPARER